MRKLGVYFLLRMLRDAPKGKLPSSRDIDGAIEQLLGKTECPTARDREQLHSLLHEFSDIISIANDDLGWTDLVQHKPPERCQAKGQAKQMPFSKSLSRPCDFSVGGGD